MTFTDFQKAQLAAKLDASHVKQRAQAGRQLSFIEGWWAIAEANRIFGFDGWSRETVDTVCVWSGERNTQKGPKPAASYICRVRVKVGDIVREGTGSGSGFGNDVGEAHESAVKEAETDAMKRALMTFGNPFGLALYDKTQENVERNGNGNSHADPIHEAKETALTTDRHLLINGETRSQYDVSKAKRAEKWTSDAISVIGQMMCREHITDWWRENEKALTKLRTDFSDEYERLCVAADERRDSVPSVMQA